MTIKQALEKEALDLGFAAFGVAAADYDPVAHNAHLRWLDRGYQGSMAYLERGVRRRFDPRVHLPGARSVIVCAHAYYSEPKNDPARPYVSIYARGENYHTVLRDKLESLCRKMREHKPDLGARIFVDSSPISEKTFAVKAGIGFVGRNGLVIVPKKRNGRKNPALASGSAGASPALVRPGAGSAGASPAHGSFFFLGLVITDLALEPDSPGEGSRGQIAQACGQCRKCIEACPTEALVGDGVIDATRCISYHTTQNKGAIPEDIAKAMSNMVFGCDICQLVCPYNSRVSSAVEPRFIPNPELVGPDPQKLLDLTEEEFRECFERNSIGEFSQGMFRRNVEIAIKNIKNGKKEH